MEFVICILYLAFCFVIGGQATKRNRSSLGWFLLSLITTPIIAAVFLLLVGDNDD